MSEVYEITTPVKGKEEKKVRVIVRVKPLSSDSSSYASSRCAWKETEQDLTWVDNKCCRSFSFDYIASEDATQHDMFTVVGIPAVQHCLAGHQNCVFAYGETGSGKTHTIMGDLHAPQNYYDLNTEKNGLTIRILHHLFNTIKRTQETGGKADFLCKCSFLEIYNEHIIDLLHPASKNLCIRKDAKNRSYVPNIREPAVNSFHEVALLLVEANHNRSTACTNANEQSSRSHLVFTITVERHDGVKKSTKGAIKIVDLAGAESRQVSGCSKGDRLKESININKSLSTLGHVVAKLAQNDRKHVPFRDSKLTYLLQDSLCGNSKTVMIATVNPAKSRAMETLRTLLFANRAKSMQNTVTVSPSSELSPASSVEKIKALTEENRALRQQIQLLSRQNDVLLQTAQDQCLSIQKLEMRLSDYENSPSTSSATTYIRDEEEGDEPSSATSACDSYSRSGRVSPCGGIKAQDNSSTSVSDDSSTLIVEKMEPYERCFADPPSPRFFCVYALAAVMGLLYATSFTCLS